MGLRQGAGVGATTVTGGAGSITIREADGAPTGTVTTLVVTNGTLTDNTGGQFTLATGGAAGSVPTGTGFTHITGGVQDAASKTVDVSSADCTGTLAAARMPALTGDVTTSAGAVATTIATNAVTNAKAAQMAANTIKGNNTAGTANAADLTVAQVNAILPVFTSTLNGLTPLSGGGTTNFLRADGQWGVPGGAGATVGGTVPAVYATALVVGAGQALAVQQANASALAAAATSAQSSGLPLILPAGVIEIDVPTATVTVTANLRVKGQGIGTTSIRCFPSTGTPSWTANIFNITGSGIVVELEDFELLGPQVPSSSSAARGVYLSTATTNTSLYLRRVHIGAQGGGAATGFTIGINADNAAGRLIEIEDSDIGPCSEQGWSFNADNGATGYTGNVARSLYSYVHDVGTTSLMHLHYFHPNVATEFIGSRFGNCGAGYALQFNGSPTIPAPYQRFLDVVNDGTNGGFLVGTNNQVVDFIGGYFANGSAKTAFNVNGPINVSGATLRNVQIFNYQNGSGYTLTFNNCDIDHGANNIGSTLGGANCTYLFTGGRIAGNHASLVPLTNNQTGPCSLIMDGTVFASTNMDKGVRADLGTTYLNNCWFIGTFQTASVEFHPGAATTKMEMNGCNTALLTTGESIRCLASASAGYGMIRITDHTHNRDGLHGIYSNTLGEFQVGSPKRGVCPTPITAAATISLDPNYDTFHITGATVISKILWANSDNYTRTMGDGNVTFIFDTGAANQLTGGATPSNANVGQILSPTLTTVAKTLYTGCYDGQAFGWYIK